MISNLAITHVDFKTYQFIKSSGLPYGTFVTETKDKNGETVYMRCDIVKNKGVIREISSTVYKNLNMMKSRYPAV